MKRRCLSIACDVYFTPDAQHRFGGYCSRECARGHSSPTPALSLATVQPTTPLPTRKLVNRKHGIDYRGRDE